MIISVLGGWEINEQPLPIPSLPVYYLINTFKTENMVTLMLQSFNIVLWVTVTSKLKIIFVAIHNCNFVAVVNPNINFYVFGCS